MKSKRPEDWTAEEKLKAVGEYEKLDEQQKGKYLREKGLHSVHLQRWQQKFVEAYTAKKKKPREGDRLAYVYSRSSAYLTYRASSFSVFSSPSRWVRSYP